MKILLVVILILLTGCAKTIYVHPTKTASDFNRDKYDCRLVTAADAANWGAAGNPFLIAMNMGECLELKHGWIKSAR